MKAEEFVDALYIEAKKLNDVEFQIAYHCDANSGISLFEGKPETSESSETQVVKFSVRVNGKVGSFVYEGDLTSDMISKIVVGAQENANLITDEDESFFYDGSGEYNNDIIRYMPLKNKLEQLDKIKYLQDVEQSAYQKSSLVNKVIRVDFAEGAGKVILRNSLGLNLRREYDYASADVVVSVKNNEDVKDAVEYVDFSSDEHFNPNYLAEKVVNKALGALGGNNFETLSYKVLCKNIAFRSFLQVIVSFLYAQAVIDKKTKFGDKVGQVIARDCFTLIENPFMEGGHGTRSFDGEGYPTSYKHIVENGVLQTLLYDLKTAHKFNTKSTGNFNCSYTNIYLQKGDKSFDELVTQVDNGVLVEGVTGMNIGVNFVTGDFSVVGKGKKIENGKISHPLSPFTVSGNIYQMLQQIEAVGNDMDFYFGSTGSPSVIVGNLMLANK